MILTTPIHPSFLNNSILPCDSASKIVIAASQSNHLLIAKSQHQAKMESSQTLVYVFPNQPRVFTTTRVTVVTVPLELAATVVLNKTVFLGNPPPPNNYVSAGIPPWVHVFNNSTTTSSLRTQSASISHLETTSSLKSQHRRNHRAKKKFRKQQRLLREVIVPNDQIHTFTSHEIEQHIIVVDGGNPSNPPIRAPTGVYPNYYMHLFAHDDSLESTITTSIS